jgi:hypothetical protein
MPASQIAESFGAYGRHAGLKHAIVFGGVSQHRPPTDLDQRRANGVPVLSMIRADELFRPGRSRRETKWGNNGGRGGFRR